MRTGLIDSVQAIYNIFDQTPEARLLPLAREMNIGILARVPLDEGALSGAVTESTTFPDGDFRAYYFRGADRKKQVVEHVDALRRDLGEGDRKSTRLNSSHRCFSYAVFCLKTTTSHFRRSTLTARPAYPLRFLLDCFP